MKVQELSKNEKSYLEELFTHPTFIRDFTHQFKEIKLISTGRSNNLGLSANVYMYESKQHAN